MLEILLLWIYLLFINAAAGIGVLRVLGRLAGRKGSSVGLSSAVLAGTVSITAFAEWFSIFSNVGMVCHLILLALAFVSVFAFRDSFLELLRKGRKIAFSWEGVLYLIFVAMTAYFASRGLQHTDTGIYHAQAIRWYEEYGLVKGLGNLQQHFAYNSAYLAYAAIFSMKWLLGQSLHVTTGFFQAFLCVWALYGLKNALRHKNHTADACRIAILIYALVNAEGTMSPATDYGTMWLVLFVVTRWAALCCEEKPEDLTDRTALLSVAAVCVATYKLSAGLLLLLALYPAALLIRKREIKKILVYIGAGVLVLAPFLWRNVLISGWLLYPFPAIDLFSVDWKIPVQHVQHDSDQIKVWGKCVFDVAQADMPLKQWLPLWWDAKDRYEQMLIYAVALAVPLEALAAFKGLREIVGRRKPEQRGTPGQKIAWEQILLHVSVFACICGWFFLAPFIRYGLAFLLIFPLMALGLWIRPEKMGPVRIAGGFLCAAVFFSLSDYWDYYVLSDLVWIKHHLTDPSYLIQQDYDRVETGEIAVGNLTVYYPLNSDNISYHAFPATAYEMMAERTTMRGDDISDGFMPK